MPNLSDAIMEATGGPTINEGQFAWFLSHGAAGATTYDDAERKFLLTQTGDPANSPLTNNELWKKFLIAGGYMTQAMALNTGMLAYWLDQSGAPPQSWAYSLTVGNFNTDYGYAVSSFGDLSPTDWPDIPGAAIRTMLATTTNYFAIRATTQQQIPGIFSVVVQVEGATTGYGPDNNGFTLYWSPLDYLILNAGLRAHIVSMDGQQVGLNMRSMNNWLGIGNNGTFWGWSNGGGFGAMGDYGATYGWPFGVVIVNFYTDASDNVLVQFNQGNSLSVIHVTIPGLNGGQPITFNGNGVAFTAVVPGALALFQQAASVGSQVGCSVTT